MTFTGKTKGGVYMKKHIITMVFMVLCMATTFAETKISVIQKIRYGNGNFAEFETPQISLEKARKEGGKVFLRYDFEVTGKGFLDCDSIYAFLKFPDSYRTFQNEFVLKVTALSGATDVALDVLEGFKGDEDYSALRNSIGRLPNAKYWIIRQKIKEKKTNSYKTDIVEETVGILLRIPNTKGNKASIEFYLDFDFINELYEYWKHESPEYAKWIWNNCFQVIPIDISFHNQNKFSCGYAIPLKDYVDEFGYDRLWIDVEYLSIWENESSKSDHSFTLLIRD